MYCIVLIDGLSKQTKGQTKVLLRDVGPNNGVPHLCKFTNMVPTYAVLAYVHGRVGILY